MAETGPVDREPRPSIAVEDGRRYDPRHQPGRLLHHPCGGGGLVGRPAPEATGPAPGRTRQGPRGPVEHGGIVKAQRAQSSDCCLLMLQESPYVA